MDKRTLLAVALSIGVVFVYQTYFAPKPVPQPVAPTQQTAPGAAQPTQPAPPAAAVPSAPSAIQAAATGRMVTAKAGIGAERDVVVETPLYRAVFSTRGAALKSFQLKQYRTALKNEEDLVDIFYRLIGKGKPKPAGNRVLSNSSMSPRVCRGRWRSPSPIRRSTSPSTDSMRQTGIRST